MQVIKVSRFGDPDVLEVGEADLPKPRPDEVLVRVLAAGVGPWGAPGRLTARDAVRVSAAASMRVLQ